jgi:hypothetical protein
MPLPVCAINSHTRVTAVDRADAAVLVLNHFCEVHGPNIVFSTLRVPRATATHDSTHLSAASQDITQLLAEFGESEAVQLPIVPVTSANLRDLIDELERFAISSVHFPPFALRASHSAASKSSQTALARCLQRAQSSTMRSLTFPMTRCHV